MAGGLNGGGSAITSSASTWGADMGNSGLFGWLAIGLIAAGLCGAGIRWLREDAVADLRREIAIETQRVRQAAQIKAAETAAQSEHEALAAETADAEREH